MDPGTRSMSTSFADMYRQSVGNAEVRPGDVVQGRVVGQRRPRSSSSRFYIVDFGLKSEAPFSAKEVPGVSVVGDAVAMPLVALEDDFNEPNFDFEHRSELPSLLAERYELLTRTAPEQVRILHGRFASFKRGGASVKVLGMDAFAPRHHVVALDRPVLGSFAPFYLMSMVTEKRAGSDTLGLDVNPVVSSYGGILFSLANLVGLDSAWEASGGGSAKDRIAYLRLLTRLLHQKNANVRKIMPKYAEATNSSSWRRNRNRQDEHRRPVRDAPWLHGLPMRGGWSSSNKNEGGEMDASSVWHKLRTKQPQEVTRETRSGNNADKTAESLRGRPSFYPNSRRNDGPRQK